MQLEQELKEKTADIEKLLERMLPEEAGLQKTIFSAMRYSLMAGGKPSCIIRDSQIIWRRGGGGISFYGCH